ncbi:MAG TPA: hypothetical protein PLL75_06705 [Candidatus Omnitrophota bacterium]|nr:hypothetical protein [Candidatus Omnitrophota bacterium]HPS37395.1 hypothetical protein [Candidatus Omnitrophota bacterium]
MKKNYNKKRDVARSAVVNFELEVSGHLVCVQRAADENVCGRDQKRPVFQRIINELT